MESSTEKPMKSPRLPPTADRHNGVEVEEEVLLRYGDICCQVVEPHLGEAFR